MLCSENDRPSFLSELVGGPKTHDRLSPDCRGCLWTAVPIPMYIGTLAPARRGARARSNDGQERGEKNSASYLAREGSFSPASSRNAAQKAEATDSDRTLVNMGETAYSQGKDEASARSSAGIERRKLRYTQVRTAVGNKLQFFDWFGRFHSAHG